MSVSLRHIVDVEEQIMKDERSQREVMGSADNVDYEPVRLTWGDLNVTVVRSKGPVHQVLQGLTGYAEAGCLTALMGPSGSGKSTLLDALAGRLATNAFRTGAVLVNGQPTKLSFGAAAYVTQEDCLIGTLTVREMISYSARLRLPEDTNGAEKKELVENTIVEMGLQDCADTVIGNWHLRGISGGEKRRVSIALEIIMKPKLLFLDEPTSGLDSASAFFVVKTLHNLARCGRTIVAAIHQPSSEVFQLFDYLSLLSSGKTIYFGRASEANQFFAEAGFPCPPQRNPSDHFLRCVNLDFDKAKAMQLVEPSDHQTSTMMENDPMETTTATEATKVLIEFYYSSPYYSSVQDKVNEVTKQRGIVPQMSGGEASFITQTYTLTKRSFVNMTRDFGYYWLRLAMYIALSIFVGIVFHDVGTDIHEMQSRVSCSLFILAFLTFMSIGGFPSFVEDMKVFQKERLNGHYGVTTFVISNTFSSLPFLFLIALTSGTIAYYMAHLHPGFNHYFYFVLCLFACVAVVESMMMAIASIVPNFLMGIVLGASMQGFFILLCGFFRLPNDIPKPVLRYPVTYISFLYWGIQGQLQNDIGGMLIGDNATPGFPKVTGEYVLQNVFQVDLSRSKWLNLGVIFSMVIIYRILFFVMIKISEDVTPWIRGWLAKNRLRKSDGEKLLLPPTWNGVLPLSIITPPKHLDRSPKHVRSNSTELK